MNDGWLFGITLLLSALGLLDWYVASKFVASARERPHITMLNLGALRSIGIAIATTIFAVLGFSSGVFLLYGVRLLPPPISTVLLVIGAIVISLPNLYFIRVVRDEEERW